jgi:DNA recombination protein RmuC
MLSELFGGSQFVHPTFSMWYFWVILVVVLLGAFFIIVVQRRFQKLSLANEVQLYKAESDRLGFEKHRLEQEAEVLCSRIETLRNQKNDLELLLAKTEARWQEKEYSYAEKLELLRASQESLTKEFERIANRLFDDKQQQFAKLSSTQIETIIQPFHQQLRDFHQRVDDFHRQDIAHRSQLMGQISELQKQSLQIGQDAAKLTNALKNNKTQGSWGEVVLERVLEQAGLEKGREFATQVSLTDEHGNRFQPDAIIYLPDAKHVVVDAKVSLNAYERYVNAESSDVRFAGLKEHIDSVRTHIKSLASKDYHRLPGIHTLDFVCLFIPIEAAFVALAQNAPEVLREAYEKKIILVSPSSLLLVLKIVDSLWQREKQDRNVEFIVASAGKLHDQFVRFVESMNEIGVGLDRAKSAHLQAWSRLTEGRGNLVKRVNDLQRLGAKASSKLPSELVLQAQESDLGADLEEVL